MSTIKIKRGDQVVVIAGAFKGIIGTVLKIDTKKQVVYVSGVRPNVKYQKKNVASGRTSGQMFDKPRPVHISNVMFYETDKGASRIAIQINENGDKIRVAKKTKTVLKAPVKNILITTQEVEATQTVKEIEVKPAKKPTTKKAKVSE
jgi:large subunit ribosomal protein L24